jgi:cell division protein FtsL
MRFREYLDFQPVTKKELTIVLSLAMITLAFSFLIHVRVQQTLVGYTIAEREDIVLELEDQLRQLKLESAVLKRPERIQEKAHDWFKMRYSHE